MEFIPLEINAMHAKDVKNVNVLFKMDVYAVVSISGDPRTRQLVKTDKHAGTKPKWNSLSLKFNLDTAVPHTARLTLDVYLRSRRRLLGDRDIGSVHVPVKELLETNTPDNKVNQLASYQVRTPTGKPRGILSFWYTVGEKFKADPQYPYPALEAPTAADLVMAYPPPVPAYPQYPPPPQQQVYPPPPAGYPGAYGYPLPQQPYPPQVGYAPPPGYGYQPPGYGYQQQPGPEEQQTQKKGKFGGMGLGLGAGLLGGLLIGDMVSDMGEDGLDF